MRAARPVVQACKGRALFENHFNRERALALKRLKKAWRWGTKEPFAPIDTQ